MTPGRLGVSGRPPGDRGFEGADDLRTQRGRAVAVIVGMLIGVAALHFLTPMSEGGIPVHLLYRRLYFIPIIYAAWIFGKRGGVLAAAGAAIPFVIHAQASMNVTTGLGFDNYLEVTSYFAAGLLFGAVRDVEESKTRDLRQVSLQLEEAYKKLEERAIQLINVQDYTSSILRSITSAVLTVGPDGSVATANPAAERMLGISEFEMVPKPIKLLFRDDGGLSGDVSKVLAGRLPLAMRDASVVTAGGNTLHIQASTSRMRAVGGTVLGAVVTLEDVSDIKALTDQLIRADRLAAMGELTAGVAHEVRNPLGIIRASVQLLEDANCEQERIHEAAGVIKQEIDRLDKVIKALLDFGRPSKPTLVKIDMRSVLEDVVLFTNRFAKQANVQIVVNIDADDLLPVFGDPDQLKQVFLNLVTNAVQAMDESGGTIEVSGANRDDYVSISVKDDGPGVAAEDLNKVFDPFFTKRADGTGLGLTIVHRIIDEHDGRIEVESTNAGTTFTVTLPASIEG